jgi:hypothetical protein
VKDPTYPVIEEKFVTPSLYLPALKLSTDEQNLILRMRELRRQGEVCEVLLNIKEMTLKPIGSIERLAKA